MVPGKNMGSYMVSKVPKNHKKITQKWHVFHIIWALKPTHALYQIYHWNIECPKDKIIIYMVPG